MSSRVRAAVIVAAVFLAGAGLAAQESPAGLPPEAVLELQIPEEPRLSPDGTRLAYVRRFVDRDGEEYTSIFVEPTAGGGVERITDGPRVDRTPRFSPDGNRIAWIAFVDGFWEIRVRDLATRGRRELVPGSLPPGTIAWSPAGDRIAYTRILPDPGRDTGPVHVFVVRVSGGTPTRVTSERLARGDLPLDGRLAWTELGRSIVLSAAPGGDRDIYEVELASRLDRRIAERAGPDVDPAVSPAGDFVAFTGPPDGAEDGPHALFVADRGGSGPARLVSRDPGGSIRHPVWAPGGGGIYALVETGQARRLVFVRLDGTGRTVAEGVDGRSFDVSADAAAARFAYVSSRPARAPEVYVGHQSSMLPGEPVTTLNYGMDPARLGRPTVVGGPSDGDPADPAEGESLIAILPPGVSDPAEIARGTLVVDSRADARPSESFDVVRQVLAGAGAVVLTETEPKSTEAAIGRLLAEGRVSPDRVYRLGARSDAVAPGGVEPLAVEAPYAAGLDWGTVPWRALAPADRVAKLRAALAWLAQREERARADGMESDPG